jgi:citrate synthase
MNKETRILLENYSRKTEINNHIDISLYDRFDVKRGLRNSDGTGVLVGLTTVGNVHGYILDEKDKVPVPGQLFYRGYDLTELVNGFQKDGRFGFEETVFLLIFGELPKAGELKSFKKILGEKRNLPDHFAEDMILKAPSSNIMNKLARSVLASYSYDNNPDDLSTTNTLRQCLELIARFPTMVAYGYQAKRHYYDGESLFIHKPDPGLSTSENLLTMVRPDRGYTKLEAETLDLCLVIHAEHGGGNNSTFSIHVVSSTATDSYSAIAAAVGSLKGPKHGGANIKVYEMMQDLKRNVSDWLNESQVTEYLEKILQKKAFDGSGLIYGIGHAVYTLSDPRAELLRRKAEQLAAEKGREEELNLYLLVEKLAPGLFNKTKNTNKVMAANVDYYSGFVYDMLNIPTDLYTPIFAVARIAGWCAHMVEERISGGKIIRPAFKNVINTRDYLIMNKRK